ncbi:MAG: DNA repair and recombination protein RadB [bacterium]|nr:DNA repair and recombination protein RadB [bacterium]
MDEKLSSGSAVLDSLLAGGYEKDVVTAIYGPASSGKTTACLLCCINTSKNKKIIFIDTEGGFSISRLKQLTPDYKKVLDRVFLFNPTTFEEQKKAFETLNKSVNDKIGLIVVDTISSLYRVEKASEDYQTVNKELGRQMSLLVEIARKKKIPVLLTSQVYADFEKKDAVKLVGGNLINYASKCLVELQVVAAGKRKAVLRKHRSLPEKEEFFEIKEKGFAKIDGGFKLF